MLHTPRKASPRKRRTTFLEAISASPRPENADPRISPSPGKTVVFGDSPARVRPILVNKDLHSPRTPRSKMTQMPGSNFEMVYGTPARTPVSPIMNSLAKTMAPPKRRKPVNPNNCDSFTITMLETVFVSCIAAGITLCLV